MTPDRYSEIFAIPCYMFDLTARLRPGAVMDIAQELAAKGSEQMHFADHDLAPHHLVWILARMSVVFDRTPVRLDTVTARTWHRGLHDGLFYLRDYDLIAADGKPAVRSTSSWVIMDTDTRRLALPDRIGGVIPTDPQCGDAAVADPAPRLVMPRGVTPELISVHRVVGSDLDYNGHTNNAKYIVWSFDALGTLPFERPVKAFSINFNRETHLGDSVELLHTAAPGSPDTHYVEGRCGGAQSFIVRIDF